MTRFEVDSAFAERYPVQQAGGSTILELWVPAEELDDFNRYIIGPIEVVGEYRGDVGTVTKKARTKRSGPFQSAGLIEAYGNLFPQVEAVHARLVPVNTAETTAPDTGSQ